MSLQGAIDFLAELMSGRPRQMAIRNAAQQIVNTLWNRVYVNDLDTLYSVPTAAIMRSLIGSNSVPPAGPPYSPLYYQIKLSAGVPVHEWTGVMKANTLVEFIGGRIHFSIPTSATTRWSRAGPHNFGPVHEARRSVLKATMVLAWNDLMNAVVETYRNIAESFT